MRAILISIQSPHTCNILNGIKWWEIRKRFPKDYVGWVYIYVTKGKETLYLDYERDLTGDYCFVDIYKPFNELNNEQILNGKVVARFWCDKVEEIPVWKTYLYANKNTCLSKKEIEKYLEVSAIDFELDENYIVGKAIHITKLEIFDKPKEISEFSIKKCKTCIANDGSCYLKNECQGLPLTRAPQSWCYVEV